VFRTPQQPMLFGTTSANRARVPIIYSAVVYISFHDAMRMKREHHLTPLHRDTYATKCDCLRYNILHNSSAALVDW